MDKCCIEANNMSKRQPEIRLIMSEMDIISLLQDQLDVVGVKIKDRNIILFASAFIRDFIRKYPENIYNE